jgi:hypothetical protein
MSAQQAHNNEPLRPSAARQQQQQQVLSSPYGKVASWLNSTYSSGAGNSIKPKAGPGPPLINKFSSSLLWYIGLGGALHHKQRLGQQQVNTPQQAQQQQQQQAATGIASATSGPGSTAGQPAHTATAAAAAAPAHGLPMSQQGVLKSVSQGPASHPLTLQQLEQSLEFSTSSSSAGSAAAPVQAVTKGKAAHMCALTARSCCHV